MSSSVLNSFVGLYVESVMRVARKELAWECDYLREAECATKFRWVLSENLWNCHIRKNITKAYKFDQHGARLQYLQYVSATTTVLC